MGPALKLFAAVLVLVRCTKDGDDLLLRGERDRSGHPCAGPLGGFHNPLRRLVDQVVLIALELDTDFLAGH